MANLLLEALSGEEILESNSLATVTENCVVIRGVDGRSQMLISLSSLSSVKILKVAHARLLVISSGLFILSAAAFCSKEGDGAGIPIALVGIVFVIAYLMTRKAYLAFTIGRDQTYSRPGTLAEASMLATALRSAMKAQRDTRDHTLR